MIKKTRAEITKCIIHKVANKFNSGQNAFSEDLVRFDQESYDLIKDFLLKPFTTLTQSYRFTNGVDARLNRLNSLATDIFENEDSFIDSSILAVKHLFEQSNSAQIKTGDVLVVKIEGIEYQDQLVDAIGIFKIESKVDFLQTYLEEKNFDVVIQKGISTKKLDKGMLLLNTSDVEGRVVLSVDNNNYDAQYWIKNFLEVEFANDRNLHTQEYLGLCKGFADDILAGELANKKERANFLAGTVDYFKENEDISLSDFKIAMFEDEDMKERFEEYLSNYEKLNDTKILNNFEVSGSVLKKEKGKLKTQIKLDTNIQINLDIDSPEAASEYLERGYDSDRKMKFYKVYFNEEK